MRTFHRHSYNLLSVCLFGLGLWMGFGQDLLGQNNRSKYQVYTVQKGDDLVSLMSRFGMCQTHFLALNPELRDLINHSGELSELSSESSVIVNSPNYIKSRKFIDHKVGRKETLFGIAKYYGLSANDLLADNPGIRRSGLRKGDRLKIVQNCSAISDIESMRIRDQLSHQFINIHEVAPNESLSSIADRYKMSLTELKALNQNLSDSLEVGQSIKIRPVALDTVVPVKDHFDYYVVQSKEGFFRLKQKFGLTKDEILNLNPEATSGLQPGMVLRLPQQNLTQDFIKEVTAIDLRDMVNDSTQQKIILMLPLQLEGYIDGSWMRNRDYLKGNKLLRIALDFYTGVLMARDYAFSFGFPVVLDVLDTQAQKSVVDDLISSYDFNFCDAIIGPFLPDNVTAVARFAEQLEIPVFSALSRPEGTLPKNLVQTLPDQELMSSAMMEYIKRNAQDKKMLFLGDINSPGLNKLREIWPKVEVLLPREEGYIAPEDILSNLSDNQENWLVLESRDPVIISNVIGVLNGMEYYEQKKIERLNIKKTYAKQKTYSVRLFTTDKNEAFDFDDISSFHLSNLEFTFPSPTKSITEEGESQLFVQQYADRYGFHPNKYAIRGFDLTLDIILRGAINSASLIENLVIPETTNYTESKFHYQFRPDGGFNNTAFFLLKYNQQMELEELTND